VGIGDRGWGGEDRRGRKRGGRGGEERGKMNLRGRRRRQGGRE